MSVEVLKFLKSKVIQFRQIIIIGIVTIALAGLSFQFTATAQTVELPWDILPHSQDKASKVASRTSFNINQFEDSTNFGSLRYAIIQANNSGENEVINLAEGTYTLSLEGRYENEARTGDLDIANNGTLTIIGNGNGAVINAQEIDRIFDLAEDATLILKNVTLTNGNAPANWRTILRRIDEESVGGAILVGENSSLTLIDSTISDNKTIHETSGDFNQGGGIFVYSGANVSVMNSTLSNNGIFDDDGTLLEYMGEGGGMYISENGSASITDSVITQNQAWDGAGLGNQGNTTLNSTTVSFNLSNDDGGGIYNRRGYNQNSSVTLNLNDSSITNNTAEKGYGGGIYNARAEVTLNNTKVTNNNSAESGGGIYHDSDEAQTNKLLITNHSEINNNVVFSDEADWGGGGIHNDGIMEIKESTIKGNKVDDIYKYGGAVYNAGSAKLNQVTIADNEAYWGGGIAQGVLGDLELTDSVLDSNTAQKLGGGLYLGGETIISYSTIQNNRTTGSYSDGGGIHIEKELVGSVSINDSVIANNQAVDHGGGIHNERDLVLRNTKILNNQAEDGGGVFFERGMIMVINSNIDGNRAMNGNGGGFYNRKTLNIVNSSITNNHAITNGNDNRGNGGGVYSSNGAVYLVSSTIASNTSDNDGGGMLFNWYTGVNAILNSTVIRNLADADADGNGNGGGLNVSNRYTLGTLVQNSVFAENNTGLGEASDIYGSVNGDRVYEGQNNNLIGNTSGGEYFGDSDAVNVDPLLGVLQDNGGNRLTAAPLLGSPLIDAGNNENVPTDSIDLNGNGDVSEPWPFDGRGDDRIKGERVDIGAVEGVAEQVVPQA